MNVVPVCLLQRLVPQAAAATPREIPVKDPGGSRADEGDVARASRVC